MRLCGLVLCKRILFILLLDKVSRGTGQLPRVPIPASPPFCFQSTYPLKQNGGQVMTTINLKDFYYWYIRLLILLWQSFLHLRNGFVVEHVQFTDVSGLPRLIPPAVVDDSRALPHIVQRHAIPVEPVKGE